MTHYITENESARMLPMSQARDILIRNQILRFISGMLKDYDATSVV